MAKQYDIIVKEQDFKTTRFDGIVKAEELRERLTELAPECNIDFGRVLADMRCKFFRHYMPVNKTVAKHSYKENARLHSEGNNVQVYITERHQF